MSNSCHSQQLHVSVTPAVSLHMRISMTSISVCHQPARLLFSIITILWLFLTECCTIIEQSAWLLSSLSIILLSVIFLHVHFVRCLLLQGCIFVIQPYQPTKCLASSFFSVLFAHPTQSWQRAVVSECGSAECFVLSKERKKLAIKPSWLRVFQMLIQACIAPRLDHQLKVLLLQSSLLFQQSPVWDSFSVMFSYINSDEEIRETTLFQSHFKSILYSPQKTHMSSTSTAFINATYTVA